jgi:DNA-binding SARP family transcriptional activator
MVCAPEAEFRVLGPLELWVGGRELHVRGTKRQAVLCTLLLADGKPVSMSRLVDAVWDHTAPDTATKLIRNAVSDLRAILSGGGCAITPVGDGYRLDIGGGVLDAGVFADRVVRAREHRQDGRLTDAVTELRAALSLWRGAALDGLDTSVVLRAQAIALDEQRFTVLEELVDLELAQGRHKSLTGELSAWVAENPLRERLVAQLMLALCRSGSQARALGVYEQTRRALDEELGVRPGPELQDLHRRIRGNDLSVWRPAGTSSPA